MRQKYHLLVFRVWSMWLVLNKLGAFDKQKSRVSVDYRRLTVLTIEDKHHLPNISYLLDQLVK